MVLFSFYLCIYEGTERMLNSKMRQHACDVASESCVLCITDINRTAPVLFTYHTSVICSFAVNSAFWMNCS